jgi:hypothetical protein
MDPAIVPDDVSPSSPPNLGSIFPVVSDAAVVLCYQLGMLDG